MTTKPDAATVCEGIRGFLNAFANVGLSTPFAADSLIPISEFEGQYYTVATGPTGDTILHPNPVVSLGEDLSIHLYTVSSMLDTCLD